MKKFQRIAFLFPGQGSQYSGMAQDFIHNFSAARLTFEEADDLLKRPLSTIILHGPEKELTETKNSQTGIYVASIAMLRVVQELYDFKPYVCAGLSLGEYTALTAAEWLPFRQTLPLVQYRGEFMNEACQTTQGAMAVIMGLEGKVVEEILQEGNLPHDLWVANFNCPGQVVISGTLKGIEAGIAAAKAHNAKRILPLQVQGAFHSGLMQGAKEKLAPYLQKAPVIKGSAQLVMNVPGDFVSDIEKVRHYLIEQFTHSVRWEHGIRAMDHHHIDLYIEFGPGKTLAGMNKRIGVRAPMISIEKIEDLDQLSQMEKKGELS
jgi:[acyl-carrier-protein] S-malonyltransferase